MQLNACCPQKRSEPDEAAETILESRKHATSWQLAWDDLLEHLVPCQAAAAAAAAPAGAAADVVCLLNTQYAS
jgi:hypothetical protein